MPKDKLSYLGNCIRQARNDCNLTQQDLADQSHVAIKTIQMIEKGKNKSFLRDPLSINQTSWYFCQHFI